MSQRMPVAASELGSTEASTLLTPAARASDGATVVPVDASVATRGHVVVVADSAVVAVGAAVVDVVVAPATVVVVEDEDVAVCGRT
jgi:hypothetical protein